MAMERLCARVRAERVWSEERRWCRGRSNDDQVINKKHSALCRHKAGVSISAQSPAHQVGAASFAEGFSFCPTSCTISSRTSRKRLGSQWTLEEVTRDRTLSAWQPLWKTTLQGGSDGSPRNNQQHTTYLGHYSYLAAAPASALHTARWAAELHSHFTVLPCLFPLTMWFFSLLFFSKE